MTSGVSADGNGEHGPEVAVQIVDAVGHADTDGDQGVESVAGDLPRACVPRVVPRFLNMPANSFFVRAETKDVPSATQSRRNSAVQRNCGSRPGCMLTATDSVAIQKSVLTT